jgi:hypothetical protein
VTRWVAIPVDRHFQELVVVRVPAGGDGFCDHHLMAAGE